VARRARILAFGTAAGLVVAGAVCAAVIGGLLGQVLAIALITAGLGGALLLVFYEVGLSEDRERAREQERRRRRRQ
jgi:threonine/homoserine/homoserine lactone efflux protein